MTEAGADTDTCNRHVPLAPHFLGGCPLLLFSWRNGLLWITSIFFQRTFDPPGERFCPAHNCCLVGPGFPHLRDARCPAYPSVLVPAAEGSLLAALARCPPCEAGEAGTARATVMRETLTCQFGPTGTQGAVAREVPPWGRSTGSAALGCARGALPAVPVRVPQGAPRRGRSGGGEPRPGPEPCAPRGLFREGGEALTGAVLWQRLGEKGTVPAALTGL